MIRMITYQTRECVEGDAGEVVRAYYKVTDGVLRMCNEEGKPTGKSHRLGPKDDERRIARQFLREQMLRAPRSDFNRPIRYKPYGVA
jgi:hypothetical protein